MPHAWTLRAILDSGVTIPAGEAVAIVQRLLFDDTSAPGATGPYGPLTLGNVEIASDGRVRSVETAATPSVYEAAALLQELLSAGTGAMPGALRYTVGRALLEVDAPPFESREQFGAALERFEGGPRAEVIAALYRRATAPDARSADRRRATATNAVLRRELREADLRLYVASTASRPLAGPIPPRRSAGPIAGCLLAGAALIVVGGAVSTRPQPHADAALRATPERTALARDIALPQERATQPPMPTPIALVPTPPRSTARPSRGVPSRAATARQKSGAPTERPRAGRSTDRDRGVIARIRFEWDNPFR